AGHERWGVEAATRLAGEWTLVRWDERARTLTLLMSECARDTCYFAASGGRVAVSAELVRLTRLPWVDGTFDRDAVIRTMGRHSLRETLGDRSIIKGARQLQPGTSVTLRCDGMTRAIATPHPAPALIDISFEEAMREVETLLRRIVRSRLAGPVQAAFLLSGGLDSSLLAWLGVEERLPHQTLHFLSSAAPAGSGIKDETGWAQLVADHLGASLTHVCPAPDAEVYAPSAQVLAEWEAPVPSPRHYLYRAFEDAAAACGSTVLVDGLYGELSVTSHGFFLEQNPSWPHRLVRSVRGGLGAALHGPEAQIAKNFHVQLSRSALADMAKITTGGDQARQLLLPDEPFGFEPGWEKSALQPTSTGHRGVRLVYPLRDRRLLRLVGTFPAAFARHDGAPRSMARALLKGRLPDTIAFRECKMPFSPTWPIMMQDQAPAARALIAAQREAGAGEWLDLEWLDRSLAQVASQTTVSPGLSYRVQATALAAEFFRWWSERAAGEP
ncbi:asparagine synthase-related protein, partial [Brevundimonas sp. UBA2497]